MGLAGARNSAVTGLQAQSTNISISADNIANAATPGYKAITAKFSTLVTNSDNSTGFSSGGVNVNAQTLIETQGLIEATGRVTDLAITGSGFFAVQDESGTLLLTRAGSFDINNKGELVNSAGYQLLGWPLDNDGLRPGEPGNLNTTAAESAESLVVIDTDTASGTASATTTVNVGMNLNAGQGVFQGATVTFEPASTPNASVSSTDIIVPAAGMEEGDRVTFTSNSVATTFEYGGFARSADLANVSIFGASTANATFTTSSTAPILSNGDKFTITSTSSGTVTFTFQQSSPDTSAGQFNSYATLATAINATNGLTARVSGTTLYVSSDDATEALTFADIASSNLSAELGFSDVAAAGVGVNRWNTFAGLKTLIDGTTQLGALINNPSSGASIDIFSSDPTLTLTVDKEHSIQDINLLSDENGNNTEDDLIVPVDGSNMTRGTSTVTLTDSGGTDTFTYGGIGATKQIGTGSTIFGASSASAVFSDGSWDNGDQMTLTTTAGTVLLEYQATIAAANQFNSLDTLAAAINQDADFIARVQDGILYIAASANANHPVTISAVNTDPGGELTSAVLETQFGGDFADTAGALPVVIVAAGGGTNWATLSQLSTLINAGANTDITATLTTGSNASILLTQDNDESITIGGASNTDLLVEMGLAAGDLGDGFFSEMQTDGVVAASASTAIVSVTYDPSDANTNMAGGNITPHFTRNVRMFDALGTGHDFRLTFLKTGSNRWAVEVYALNPSEITGRSDGQIVSGTVVFNGDGSLSSVSTALTSALTIPWTTGASSSTVSLSLGTAGQPSGTVGATVIGLTDGLRQFDAAYNVEFIDQNGVAAGQFKGISVESDGTVNAHFSNGEVKAIYQLPILVVANQNALSPASGNVFSITQQSGDVNLKVAGQGGAGLVVPGALEGSTSDIAEELTRTIGIQSNYNANATLISTIKDMEDELNRRL